MASTSHMTLSNRKGNVDFLLSFLSDLTDDTDDIDDVFSKNTMNRWNSCPQLDEISNKEENTNTTDFAVNIARHSLTALSLPDLSDLCSSSGNPEVVTKDTRDFNKSQGADQDSDSYSSDSDGEKRFPDYPFSESDGEGHSEKQPFRQRTNVVSSLRRTALVSTRQSPRKKNPIPRGASIVSSRESPSGEKPLQHLKNVVPTKGNK